MARQRPGKDPIRARLVAAAQRVLTRDGLAAVTVRKVAAEAGLSVGVLYNHFENSDDLLAAALAAQMSAAGASLPAQSKGDIVMFAQALLDQIRHNLPFATTLIDRPALQAKLMEHAGGFDTPRLGGEVTAALLAAQGRGEVNAEADVEGVVLGVTTLVHGVGLMELLGGRQTTPEWLARLLIPYTTALSTKPGR